MNHIDLKLWRLGLGISQTKAAELLGIKLRQYSKLETGRSRITRTIELLATHTHPTTPPPTEKSGG